jgi:error-prone DNA polymerase
LGYRAIAITDECSLSGVVKAHVAAKHADIQLIIGSEFNLQEKIKIVALAPNRRAYSELSGLITLARRRCPKGQYQLALCDIIFHLKQCLVIWIPEDHLISNKLDESIIYGQQLRRIFKKRLWLGVEHFLNGNVRHQLKY